MTDQHEPAPPESAPRVGVLDEDRLVGPVGGLGPVAQPTGAPADEPSIDSFPASDAPASWASEPGSDPVVRPGGSGVWTPTDAVTPADPPADAPQP